MRNYKKLKILRQYTNLQNLNEEEFNRIKSFFIFKEVKKNEYLYQFGDAMEAVYFLFSGKVKIYNTNIHGKELLLHLYTGKDVLLHIVHYFYVAQYGSNELVLELTK